MNSLASRVARRFLAATVSVTIDVDETLAARKRFPLFDSMVVGTFDSSFSLYRAFDGPELKRILQTGKITGGKHSVPAERAYGASWGHDITEVIQGLNRERGGRLGADLYLAKIDALDRRFAHLGPNLEIDPNGPKLQKATMQAERCNVGLGCSVLVDASDVDDFFIVHPNHQMTKLDRSKLRELVDHIEVDEPETKKEPQKVRGEFAIKQRDKFTVAKGSTTLGIGIRNYGTVLDVYQLDWGDGRKDPRTWVQLAFTFPLQNGDSARRTMYAIHANALKDFGSEGVKLHARSSHIVVRRRLK